MLAGFLIKEKRGRDDEYSEHRNFQLKDSWEKTKRGRFKRVRGGKQRGKKDNTKREKKGDLNTKKETEY